MKRALRTTGLPPAMVRRPRRVPLSRLKGATPVSAAIWRVEPAKLRHLGNQGAGDPGSNAWNADQKILSLAPSWRAADGNVDVVVDLLELGLQGSQHAIHPLEGAPGGEHAPAIALSDHHLDECRRRAISSPSSRCCGSASSRTGGFTASAK